VGDQGLARPGAGGGEVTATQQRLIAVALVVAERWGEMIDTRQGVATRADARAILQLVKAAKAYKRESQARAAVK
jgi:hypothetical protein